MSEPFNFTRLDRPGRPTNAEICEVFRALLTAGATNAFDQIERTVSEAFTIDASELDLLGRTKPWRSELWKAFAEIEERLDPLGVETRRREKAAKS